MIDSPDFEFIIQGLLDLVPDGSLGVGHTTDQGDKMHALAFKGDFRAAQDKTDLSTVSMGDHHAVSQFNDIHQTDSGLNDGLILIFDSAPVLIAN